MRSEISFFQLFLAKPCMHISSVPCVPHALPILFSLFDHLNIVWRRVKTKNLITVQFSPVTPSIRPTYLRHFLILEHPEPLAYRQRDSVPHTTPHTPHHTHTHTIAHTRTHAWTIAYTSIYFRISDGRS